MLHHYIYQCLGCFNRKSPPTPSTLQFDVSFSIWHCRLRYYFHYVNILLLNTWIDGWTDGRMDGWMDGFSVLLMYSTVQHVGGFGIFRCSQRAVDPLCRDNEQRPSHRSFVYHSPKRQNPGINPPRCHASFRVTAPVPSPDDDIYCHIHCEVYELRRHSNSENRPCLNMT